MSTKPGTATRKSLLHPKRNETLHVTTVSAPSNSNSSHVAITAIHDNNDSDATKNRRRNRRWPCLYRSPLISLQLCIMTLSNVWKQWTGAAEFGKAQLQMAIVLLISYIGNNWQYSYPRNDNHNPSMFWAMNGALLVIALSTMTRIPTSKNVQLLSRPQTEEWKGWMQFAFIMYHYYRMYKVYNEIRVFVSAYVWMTGFGNFLYFDKKQDFSIERAISMWLRINYFPLLLSFVLNVKLENYYVVPLHTAGFFITMFTCYFAKVLESYTSWSSTTRNAVAIALCFVVHAAFYETELKSFLKIFSDEYYFRFQVDKYSAVIGILSGFFWGRFKEFMNWCYGSTGAMSNEQKKYMWYQRIGGALLILLWWSFFGYMDDKLTYNPIHPYIFWMPVAGYLMVRNSSKYLTEIHSHALEFLGRITLETYVLQFHVFMCQEVQHIPIIVPGSGAEGDPLMRFLNMLLCGTIFVALACWARQITVTTQTTFTEFLGLLMGHVQNGGTPETSSDKVSLTADDKLSRKQSDSDVTIMAAAPPSTGVELSHKASDDG